jgi:hypothetical protein
MARHCSVTGLPVLDCDCGVCDDVDTGPDPDDPEDDAA